MSFSSIPNSFFICVLLYHFWAINETKLRITFQFLPQKSPNNKSALLQTLQSKAACTNNQRKHIIFYSPDKVLMTRSTSLFSSSWIICKYVFCVVVILACPSLLATLAIDTPANKSNDACV